MRSHVVVLACVIVALHPRGAAVQAQSQQASSRGILLPSPAWRAVNRSATTFHENGRDVIRLDERRGDGLAGDSRLSLRDGDIDIDVRGRDVQGASFVGLAFHVANDSTYEVVYLRPFNFRATDSTRHAHAIQYVAEPSYGWERLRNEHPGKYEAALAPAPAPGAWVHLRVTIRGRQIQAFVDNASTPALTVTSLSSHSSGGVAIWVGNGSNGDFSNFRVSVK
jgi:hypothetical protein